MSKRVGADSPDVQRTSLVKGIRVVWCVALVAAVVPAAVWSLFAGSQPLGCFILSALVAFVLVAVYSAMAVAPGSATPRAPRLASAVMGCVSVGIATYSAITAQTHNVRAGVNQWFVMTAVGLVVLLLVSFIFEMARRDRTKLIDSLSTVVTAGAVAWCAGGWVFFANLIDRGWGFFLAAAVIVIAFSLVLFYAVSKGVGSMVEAGDFDLGVSEVGTELVVTKEVHNIASSNGVLPVMLAGALVPLLVLAGSII